MGRHSHPLTTGIVLTDQYDLQKKDNTQYLLYVRVRSASASFSELIMIITRPSVSPALRESLVFSASISCWISTILSFIAVVYKPKRTDRIQRIFRSLRERRGIDFLTS